MPNHKSCKKRMVTSESARLKNRAARSRMKTAVKKVVGATTKEDATRELSLAFSTIDKNLKAGIIHKNNAAKKKSRLAKSILKISA